MARPRSLAAVIVLGLAGAAQAQVAPDQSQRPREIPQVVPAPGAPAPAPKLEAPAAPQEAPALSGGLRILVRGFRFTGNTVVSEAELQAIAAPFAGRELGNADIDELRVRLTRRYVDAGYINSGARIPDQDGSDGIIHYEIVEGRLTDVVLGGRHRFDPDFLRRRIAIGAEPVLNINRLQDRMQVLLQDPMIERMAAELGPGLEPGEAVLRVDVTEGKPFVGGLTLSNDRSPAVGADQGEAFFTARNLFGRGDTLTLRGAATQGFGDGSAGITWPLNPQGTTLSLRRSRTRSRVIEAPLDQLDVGARSDAAEVGLTHPWIETPNRTATLSATLVKRITQSTFLGLPSPFIPGVPDGRTVVSAARFGVDWVDRSLEQVYAGRLLWSRGLDAFGSTISTTGTPDSRFNAVLAQVQWVRNLFAGQGLLLARAEGQWSNDTLLGSEKYSLGGIDSVRGYRKDQLVRDSGWFGSVEVRYTVGHLPLSGNDAPPTDGAVRLALFVDAGQARDHAGNNPGPALLASWGPGVRWEMVPGLELQFYKGFALRSIANSTTTAADRGLHLRLGYTRAF